MEKSAKLSVILRKSLRLSLSLEMELPKLWRQITWYVSLDTAKVIFVKHKRVFLLFCHNVEDFVFNVSLDEIFEDVKVMFDDDCVAVFEVDFVNLIWEGSHVGYLIDVQWFLMFWSGFMLLRLLFLNWKNDTFEMSV